MARHNEVLFCIQMSTAARLDCLGPIRAFVSYIAYTEMKLMTAGDLAIGRDLQVVETERSTRPRGHGLLASLAKQDARLIVIERRPTMPVHRTGSLDS